jgi:predicted nucleic acid-binding protein
MVGLDTGFFVGMIKGNQPIIEIWQNLNSGDTLPVVSVLTLGELLDISFRAGTPDVGKALVDNIDLSSRVIPVNRNIIEKAASLKAGRSLPSIDSIILATFMLNDCKTIHTTDRNHFSKIKNREINFVFH